MGFHIRHIAGSVDRLITYLEGKRLSEAQMVALRAEKTSGATREELLAGMDAAFRRVELAVPALNPARLAEPRAVGRKRLPMAVASLLAHIAEHTGRHVGQAISAAKWVRIEGSCLALGCWAGELSDPRSYWVLSPESTS